MRSPLLSALFALSLTCAVRAAERVWTGADGSNWTSDSVWAVGGLPAGAPENTDSVTISNGTAVSLTSAALIETNRFALVQLSGNQRGTLVVGPGGYLPTVGLSISQNGVGPNFPGRVIVDGGSLNVTGAVLVGTDNINNPGRLEIVNGGSFTNSANGAAPVRVYNGTILVSNATFSTAFTTYIHGSSTTNVFEVIDSTVNMTALAIGRDVQNGSGKACRNILRVRSGSLNMSGTIEIGHTGMSAANITGVVEQVGGTVTIGSGGAISMPVNSYAVGYYNLNGGRLSLLNANDSMRVGGRDAPSKGYFTMTDGLFTNRGNTVLGTMNGSYARLEQSGGTSFFEKAIQVGALSNSVADLNLLGGSLTLSAANANIVLGNFSNALGRCYVGNGYLSGTGRTLLLGAAPFGKGIFVQNGGVVSNASTVIGSAYASSGTLVVSNGLFATASGMNLGNSSNALGRCEVDGGLLNVNGQITVGVGSNSWGTFVMNGGVVSNTSFIAGNILTTTGAVSITGGQIYSAGEFFIGHGVGGGSAQTVGGIGTFSMSGGRLLTTGRFVLGSYGSGYAAVSGGEIEALRNGGSDQCVEVGRDQGTFGQLVMTGGALKGTNELVIARDAGSTGTVAVAGGDLYFNSIRRGGGLHTLNLAGGTLHPYNRDPAFAFTATLTNDIGFGDSGTRFGLSPVDKDGVARTMHATCTFRGNGGLAKRDAGTVTLGGTLAYTGDTVVEAGTLALSNAVASLASGAIEVRPAATLDVSVLRATPFAVVSNQTLRGAGTVLGPVCLAAGATAFGGTETAAGVLTINGTLSLDTDAILRFYLLGAPYSRIHVTGNVVLPASLRLDVVGEADLAAQGVPFLTWEGELLTSGTRWSVTGAKDPIAVLNAVSKSLTLSYAKGTVMNLL